MAGRPHFVARLAIVRTSLGMRYYIPNYSIDRTPFHPLGSRPGATAVARESAGRHGGDLPRHLDQCHNQQLTAQRTEEPLLDSLLRLWRVCGGERRESSRWRPACMAVKMTVAEVLARAGSERPHVASAVPPPRRRTASLTSPWLLAQPLPVRCRLGTASRRGPSADRSKPGRLLADL